MLGIKPTLLLFNASMVLLLHASYGHIFKISRGYFVMIEDFDLEYLHQTFIKWSKQPPYLIVHLVENP
jgi:hypothetical protein